MKGFWYEGRFYPIMAGGDGTDDPVEGDGEDGSGDDPETTSDLKANPKPRPKKHELTQAQLNDRLEQAKRSARATLAREAGFGDDVEAYLAEVKATKARRDAELTETQRLTQRAETLAAEKDRLVRENAELRLNSIVTSHATQLGFVDAMDAYRLADFASARGDDGTIDVDAVKNILGDLAKAKPYLVSKSGGASSNGSGNGSSTSQNAGRGGSNPQRTAGRQTSMTADRQAELSRRFPMIAPKQTGTVTKE